MALELDIVKRIQPQIEGIAVLSHERAILANIFAEPDMVYETQLQLEPEDFSNHINKNIYSLMLEVADGKYENIQKITPLVISMLSNLANVDIGGEEYLKALEMTRVQKENFAFSVDRVKYASIRRKIANESVNIIDECLENSEGDIDEFATRQETRFIDIALSSQGVDQVSQIGESVEDSLEQFCENKGEIEGYPTGFDFLDAEIGGLVSGELTVIGAFAKTGKSAMLLNVAKHLTCDLDEPIPVLYVDTEMSTAKQQSRLLSMLSGVPEKTIRRGLYVTEPNMKIKVETAKEIIKRIPLYHVHLTEFTMDKIINLVRKYKKQKGVKVLIFDYIKMPDNANGKFQEWQELGTITSALKNKIASKLDMAVLTAGQLNRSGSDERNLNANNMGGSIKIIQYCDNLIFLRNKTTEEIVQDGENNGNQILSLGFARNGGEYNGWINYRRKIITMNEIRNTAMRYGD